MIMTSPSGVYSGQAMAKINLFLEVTGKRPDGFHDIDSVFAEIELADSMTARKRADSLITIEIEGMDDLPNDRRNLVYRAAESLREHCGVDYGIAFRLKKNIPAGGGLGGGSSDAALALRLANACWNTGAPDGELQKIGAGIGSDVAFFFHGGVCVCRGRGEKVTPFACAPGDVCVVLALTGIHCDTAAAYRGLRLPKSGKENRPDAFLRCFSENDFSGLNKTAFNRFEETIFLEYPELARMHGELSRRVERPVRLSGSGGSLWFLSREEEVGRLVAQPELVEWAGANGVTLMPCGIARRLPSREIATPVNGDRKSRHFA